MTTGCFLSCQLHWHSNITADMCVKVLKICLFVLWGKLARFRIWGSSKINLILSKPFLLSQREPDPTIYLLDTVPRHFLFYLEVTDPWGNLSLVQYSMTPQISVNWLWCCLLGLYVEELCTNQTSAAKREWKEVHINAQRSLTSSN